jgi:hypothetical protein
MTHRTHEMVAELVPNIVTRVPAEPVPPLPAWCAAVVPVADLFMVLLLSRPATGSLRNTWVTPATLVLSVATGLTSIVCLTLAVAGLSGGLRVAVALALALLAAGSFCVAAVGLAQRIARRTS